MNYIEDFKEPIEFIFSENLLSGNNTSKKYLTMILLMSFFSDEEWSISHLIENEISKFRLHSDYDRIEIKIDGLLNNFNEKLEKNISSIENQK